MPPSVQLVIRDRTGTTTIIKRNVWAPCFEWARWLTTPRPGLCIIQVNTEFPHAKEEEATKADR